MAWEQVAAEVGLVAAHATGTPDNDASEFAALSAVFAGRLPALPVVGFKSHLGHTLGGAGAVELILSALALRDGVLPPSANSRPQDVEYAGLRLTAGKAVPAPLRAVLNTSLGFGGANTCVILESPADAPGVALPPLAEANDAAEARGESPREPHADFQIVRRPDAGATSSSPAWACCSPASSGTTRSSAVWKRPARTTG